LMKDQAHASTLLVRQDGFWRRKKKN